MRLRLLLAFVSFIASTAQAQSFHLVQAELRWQGRDVRAYPRRREQCGSASTLGPVSGGVSDTMFGPGRWVWLEPGTSLVAKPGGAPEFAVIRKRTMAYQQIPAGRTIAPDEIPATGFMLPIHERDAHLLLTGFLKVPHGDLKPVEPPAPGTGDGSSGPSYDHWPPREY